MKVDTHRDPVAVLTPAKRGCYVSRIEGPDPKWLAKRSKVKGTTLDGTAIYHLGEPGFYEVQRGGSREWLASTGSKLETVATFTLRHCNECGEPLKDSARQRSDIVRRIAHAAEGPLPGEPGGYFSDTCLCGSSVDSFDDQGFPRCADWPNCSEVQS